jgi:hypothetical protein
MTKNLNPDQSKQKRKFLAATFKKAIIPIAVVQIISNINNIVLICYKKDASKTQRML